MSAPNRVLIAMSLWFLLSPNDNVQARGGEPLRTAFRVRLSDGQGPSPPVVEDGRAYLRDRAGGVHALDTATGRTLWRTSTHCGPDAFDARAGRVVCADRARNRITVIDGATGRVVLHQTIERGRTAVAAVDGVVVLVDLLHGRLTGFDPATGAWSFDHSVRLDVPRDPHPVFLSLGERLFFTEDEQRTLWAVEVISGELKLVTRGTVPVRIDSGSRAEVAHGLIVSHTERAAQGFDIVAGRRAWRIDAGELLGMESARFTFARVARGRLYLVSEVETRAAEGGGPPLLVLALHAFDLRTGVRRFSTPLADALPWPALTALILPRRDGGRALEVHDLAVGGGVVAIAFATPADARGRRRPTGWVAALDIETGAPRWSSPAGTAERFAPVPQGLIGLWGHAGVPHGERRAVAFDPQTGAVTARGALGHTPTWTAVVNDRLWVGTEAGTVVAFEY